MSAVNSESTSTPASRSSSSPSSTSPVFLIQCSVVAWSPLAQIESYPTPLPWCRACRPKTPSTHRSPRPLATASRSWAMTASNPSWVAATASRICSTSHSSLTSRSVERNRESSSSASTWAWTSSVDAACSDAEARAASTCSVTSRSASRTTRMLTSPASLATASPNSSMLRAVSPNSASMSSSVGRPPTQNSPYRVSPKNSSDSRPPQGLK